MKICMVTSSFPRYEGDYSGFFIYEQALALAKKHDVHVIYPTNMKVPGKGSDPLYHHPLSYPFKTYPLAQVHGLDMLNTFRLLGAMAGEIRRVKRKYDIDLFYAFWTIPSAFVCALSCGETPYLAGLMGSDFKVFGKGGISRPFIKLAVRRASGIIAISNDLKREAIELGAREEKITVIPSGVDINKYRPGDKQTLRAKLGIPAGLVLLYVGSLFRLKRVDRIIKASAGLNKDFDFHVLIVGDGPERTALEDMAKRLGIQSIYFKGRVPHEEVPLYMAASDILLLFSETEGLPSSVQEAMASGIPAVTTNVGGLSDIIINGKTGYLVNDENEAEECLRRLMLSPTLTSELGLNALNFARQHLSTEQTLARINEVCEATARGESPLAFQTAEKEVQDSF